MIGALVWLLWLLGKGDGDGVAYHWFTSFDNFLLGAGRLTAFLAGYFALIEVLLLARLPFLERYVGFDRLTIWHRWNGHAVIYLALAHVVFTVWGYAKQDGTNWFTEYWQWLTLPQPHAASSISSGGAGGLPPLSIDTHPTTSPYPGIITATIGTALLVLVLVTSLVIVRRKLSYEWWYAIHFTAYAGIALAWFHMIPDGNDLIVDKQAQFVWKSFFVVALALVLWYRLFRPVWHTFRYGMRVAEVIHEAPGVVSMRITGRNLDRLHTKAGQFYFWRFFMQGLLVHAAPVLALGGAARRLVPDHGQEPRRSQREVRRDPDRHARLRRGAVRGLHRGQPHRRQGAPDRRRDRHHAGSRAARADGRRRRRAVPGRLRRDIVFSDELDRIAEERARR